ncbi:MAG TPA: radical SAM protein [Candidatus Omnitrophota bacterium]|nr:radical SAM protein [Candidatus Omnitrophota bacterium]HSA31517.1 radical SAM protein [Candidatus Omnitrophota bacterium]
MTQKPEQSSFAAHTARSLLIPVKTSCSNQCIFCSRSQLSGKEETPYSSLISELKKYPAQNYDCVEIGSDEPLNYKKIRELVSHLKASGFHDIYIQTTGRKLSKGDFLSELIDLGVTQFRIPLYGTTADLHDQITQSKGSFDETILGLKNLFQQKIKFSIHTLLLKQNLHNLPDLKKFCRDTFKKRLEFNLLHPDSEKAIEYYRCAAKFSDIPLDVMNDMEPFLPCIHRNKRIPGVQKEYTDRVQPGSRFRLERHKLPSCKPCLYFNSCDGYYLQYFAFYGTAEFQPIIQ